ncbi:RHS repeat-associated core domain-containing protein [Budvicia aquatica]|uniref:RHS repeat-associated core domain-containing protein n=1 Tax=Budvicia aquatica TaxID=82979 RepID=UPI00208C96A3|nr:RHS repeat-associated core domain-containing protein [Budvicia aquatica]GKX52739.1 hypothetical protein SOASR029_30480 [Budvicia aquatica]
MASGSPIKQKGFKRLVEPISEILTETVDSVATATTQGKIAPSGTHLSSESQGVNLGGTRSTVRSSEVTVEGTQLTTSTNHLDANNPSKTAAGDASSGTNDPLSGDPISMVTGEERLTLVDGVLPGLMPFTFQRTYASSAVETLNGLGFGWSHSLSHRLLFKDGQVEWHDHENIIITFPEPLNGKATITNQMSGAEIALTASDGIYQLTQSRGQGIYRFQRQGNEARLIAITNQYGQDITVKYDTFRRLSCVIQQGAARYHFDYHADFPELITQVVPSVYRGVDFSDTEGWQVLPAIMTYHYNDKQQLIRTVSGSGEQELYDYREDHVLIRRELAGGAVFNWEWEGEGKYARCRRQYGNFDQLDIHYQWDDKSGTSTETHLDGSQHVYQHDGAARLIYEKNAAGYEIRQTFDDKGRLICRQEADGDKTRYEYDSDGHRVGVIYPDGQSVRYDYFLGTLRFIRHFGESGKEQRWAYQYNDRDEVKCLVSPGGQETHYHYDENGKIARVDYPNKTYKSFRWDELGRLVEEGLGHGGMRHYEYQNLSTQPSKVTDEQGQVILYHWDAAGRLAEQTFPNGTRRQYTYNAYGKVTSFIDEQGRTTHYDYAEPLHLLTRKQLPDGSELHYRYDNTHLQVSDIINQKGEIYHIGYTPTGLMSEEISFDKVKTTYAYDRKGQLAEKREFGNEHNSEPLVTRYFRDPMGRVLLKQLPDGSEEQYHYDEFGRLKQILDDQNNVLAWEYNQDDQLTAEHQNWATMRHYYDDKTGQLTESKLPDGQMVGYHHLEGQLRGMTLDGNPLAAFNYDNGGRVRERRQGNGLVNRYQYDALGRLTEHLLREGFEDNPQTLWQQHYGYQSDGELTTIRGSNARDYQYDPVGQLISAGDPQAKADEHHAYHVETFQYDSAGNRISGEGSLNNAALGNRLAFFGDRHFEYDRFGNLIAERRGKEHKLLTTYEYDCRHRLIKHVSPNGRVSTYTYDTFNRRTSKTVEGKTTEFIWQGSKLIAECSDKDTVWRSYLYEPGTFRPLALVEGNAKKNQKVKTYWYQNDHLGTPHSLTDSLGALVYSCTYNAYGQVQTETQHQQQERGLRVGTNLRFQGQYADEETGLFYNLNRYYDPRIGRYLTADPLRICGGLNQYVYVDGNPVSWVDPLGLKAMPGQDSNPTGDRSPEPKTRLPRNQGHWDGEPGNGNWYSDLPEVNEVTGGAPVPFRNGRPDFSEWSKGEIEFPEGVLNGTDADFDQVYIKLKELGVGKNKTQAKNWLSSEKITPHHLSTTVIQLIPTKLHGKVPHIGSASEMRNATK